MEEQQPVKRMTEVELENRIPLNLFSEEQQFGQWWLWLILGGGAALVIIPFIYQLVSGNPIGSKPAPNMVLGAFSLMMLGMLIMFARLKLKTSIDQNMIRMSYGIFGSKKISWSDVETVDVVNYGFVGYGMRLSRNHGTVYNVDGKYGLFITLKNGKKFTIGTQKKEELEDFLGLIGRGLS